MTQALTIVKEQTPATATPNIYKDWLTPATAARLMGCSVRKVQNWCTRGTLHAAKVQIAEGVESWRIDPDCRDEFRFARGNFLPTAPRLATAAEEEPTVDLASLTATKRDELASRVRLVESYQRALEHRPATQGRTEFTSNWLSAYCAANASSGLPKISTATLYRWLDAYSQRGMSGLVPQQHYSGQATMSPEAWRLFCGMYLDESRPSVSQLYDRVAAMAAGEGWDWPSLRTVQVHVKEKLDPKLIAAGRDPKKFRDRCVPYIVRDWNSVPAMACWVADHRQLDVFVPCRQYAQEAGREVWQWRRPYLTMYIDARSWMPAAWAIRFESPDGNQTMGTFVQGVKNHGLPKVLYLDNGKDFRTNRFAGGRKHKTQTLVNEQLVKPILDVLQVASIFAIPYNAKAKIVEVFFSVMSKMFDRCFETYCGNRQDRKPERLAKLRGKAAEYAKNGFTIEAFESAFNNWITTDYSLAPSPAEAAGGMSPARAFIELREPDFAVRRPDDSTLAMLLMPSVPVCVLQNGVYVKHFGQYYWSDKLEDRRCGSGRDLKRKVIYKYNPNDPSCIWVFDAQKEYFICAATPYQGMNLNPLAVISGTQSDCDRVGDAIAMQRHIAKTYNTQARDLAAYGHSVLLQSSADAHAKLGKLDDPRTIVQTDAPRVVPFITNVEPAARALEKHQKQKAVRKTARQSLEQFLHLEKTGTDSNRGHGRPTSADALDLLAGAHNDQHERSTNRNDAS